MGIEIERKFLVSGDSWRREAIGVPYRQGYLAVDPDRTVRVRRAGEKGFLTIKGRGVGLRRPEYEYEIPAVDADELLQEFCTASLIEKIRYTVEWAGKTWVIDEFLGDNEGLLVAEIELDDEHQPFSRPDWVGPEVTGNRRYHNAYLAQHPYRAWRNGEQVV